MSAPSAEGASSTSSFTPADIIRAVSMPRVRLDVYSHGVKISRFGGEIRAMLIDMCRTEWAEYGFAQNRHTGRRESKIKRVFVGTNRLRDVFHIHRNQLELLIMRLRRAGISDQRIEIIKHEMYEPHKCEHKREDTRPPREAQVPVIDYVLAPPDPRYAPSKVVTLQTGKGKTFLGLYCMRELGSRICIVLPARYMSKWVGDVEEAYGKEKGSILKISGLKDLRNAFQMVKDGEFKARVVLISTTTMFMYLKYIEKFGVDDIVPVDPYDFYKYFGFGVRLIDEVHEEFHCNFRMDCYAHVPLTISLSATLEADQEFTNKMYNIVWPVGTWAPKMEHHKYIEIQSLQYRFKDEHLPKIRYLNFMRQYSHTELEKSIMKHKPILRNYVEMIHDIVDKKFISVHKPGQRCLVFVATKDMATIVSDHLKSSYRDKLVNRYISEDDYDRLTEADIAVSTLKSAGTAVDIQDLRTTLMTTALSTKQGNEQALGRTRPLVSYPDVNPEFLFLTAMNIDKHVTYQREKKEKLYGKALSFTEVRTHFEV